jgi:hypothetical protein
MGEALGYRCVEVEITEKGGGSPVADAVSSWVADISMRDNGAVFWKRTNDGERTFITYGEVRALLLAVAVACGTPLPEGPEVSDV